MRTDEPKLVLRGAQANDLCRMREIAVKAWEPIFRGYRERMGEELYNLDEPRDRLAVKADEVSDFYHQHPNWCLVTELDGKVVGFITFVLQHDKCLGVIGNNAVDPKCQGQGVGTAQCRRVLEIFRQEGMKYATVHTGLDPTHAPARAMYEKTGFQALIPHAEYYREL